MIPNLTIIDISHNIPVFDIVQAAFVIKNSWHSFPEGTIHLIGIDTDPALHKNFLMIEFKGHYFVGADNGIFSLIFDEIPEQVYSLMIDEPESDTLIIKNIFAKTAAHIINKTALPEYAEKGKIENDKLILKPVVEESLIRGHVIYIDNYFNVITNIEKELFEKVRNGREMLIRFRRNEVISRVSKTYSEVPEGERLCLFGQSGYLEIAMNKGEAGNLLGLRIGMPVTIEFNK